MAKKKEKQFIKVPLALALRIQRASGVGRPMRKLIKAQTQKGKTGLIEVKKDNVKKKTVKAKTTKAKTTKTKK